MTAKAIKESLLEQVRARGQNCEYTEDLINDYMSLWTIKRKLIADIRRRGVVYVDKSSTGVVIQKNNPSTKELLGVNRQMLQILKDLGLNDAAVPEDDEL